MSPGGLFGEQAQLLQPLGRKGAVVAGQLDQDRAAAEVAGHQSGCSRAAKRIKNHARHRLAVVAARRRPAERSSVLPLRNIGSARVVPVIRCA